MSLDTVDLLHQREDELGEARAVLRHLIALADGKSFGEDRFAWWAEFGTVLGEARIAAAFTHRADCVGYYADDENPATVDGCDDDCGCCDHTEPIPEQAP